jgi:hypothetical protein
VGDPGGSVYRHLEFTEGNMISKLKIWFYPCHGEAKDQCFKTAWMNRSPDCRFLA